jgi:cellulose synthase/poly-beta-1,6-N-acetylglucosamine synthase-like glycosyltransferase
VVTDGCTDATNNIVDAYQSRGPVRLIALAENCGKGAALSHAAATVHSDVLVFGDVRQQWAPDALDRLLENFADPSVGAATGDLVLESAPGVLAGVGMYWRFEKWLRKKESLVHSTVGVTGAISAVRRELFRPIPPGTILDDVCWPLNVNLQGYRAVHDGRAKAYDRLPDKPNDEFQRKVRTLAGNFQLLSRVPAALLPWRCPTAWMFISHKFCRLAVPWALLVMLLTSALLATPLYQAALAGQVMLYLLALVGMRPVGARLRPASLAASFVVLNAAAWTAFWVWVTGRAEQSWIKAAYRLEPQPMTLD